VAMGPPVHPPVPREAQPDGPGGGSTRRSR
jgi:hypothetical protein